MSTLRILAGAAVGLMACALVVSSLPPGTGSAQAQLLAEAKTKKVEKKGAQAPKGTDDDSGHERQPRSLQDQPRDHEHHRNRESAFHRHVKPSEPLGQ